MEGADKKVILRESFEAKVLAAFFSRLDCRSVRYAVLRNHESLPFSVGARDIDILVMPEDLKSAIEVIFSIANEMECLFAKLYRDDMIVQIIIFRRIERSEIFELKLDLLINRQVYGVEIYSAEQMQRNLRVHNGVPVVHEKYVFLDKWLFHLFVGMPVHPKYDAEFADICLREKNGLLDELEHLLGKGRALELITGVASGTASKMPVLPLGVRVGLLARMLARRGVRGIGHFARFLEYRLRDLVAPKGIFVSVSGPDGSGKTTVIDAVIAELKTIYGSDSVIYRHFRPEALPRIADVAKAAHAIEEVDKDYSNPHRAKPSGWFGSLVRLGYYYLDYLVGYFRSVRPVLLKREIMLFDRYYFDMICDPARSRISLPYSFLRLVGRLLPLPKYAFFIHVDPREVYRRKQELTLERIEELNSRYLGLVRCGMLREVSNNGPYHEAVAQIVDTIVKDRDARARRDLKSDWP